MILQLRSVYKPYQLSSRHYSTTKILQAVTNIIQLDPNFSKHLLIATMFEYRTEQQFTVEVTELYI